MASQETKMRPITVQVVKGAGDNSQGNVDDPLVTTLTTLDGDEYDQTNPFFVSPVDTSGREYSTVIDADGKALLSIHDADFHDVHINRHFISLQAETENPTVAITAGDITVSVASTTGFIVGGQMVIKGTDGQVREHHFDITAVVADTSITVDRPIDRSYAITATLQVVSLSMNAVGTLASPVIFSITPPSDAVWHILRILISITDQTAMDDALFGGLPALTNGVVLRENKSYVHTLTNWKSNNHMKEDMYDVNYALKAPAGFYGLSGRFTFKNVGAIVKLDGTIGDSLQILIQDDLTDLDTFRIKAQGHKEGLGV